MLAQGDLDLHAGIGIVAQHLDDAAYRLRVLGGLLHDLQHHHLPGLGAAGLARRDQEILADAAVFGHHELDAMLFVQTPDHARIGRFQHLDDLGLAPAAPVLAADARHHGVAVQRLVHFLFAQHKIGTAVFRDQEAKAVGMALHLALDQVELVHHADGTLAVAHDLAVAFHGTQAAQEQLFLMVFDLQQGA